MFLIAAREDALHVDGKDRNPAPDRLPRERGDPASLAAPVKRKGTTAVPQIAVRKVNPSKTAATEGFELLRAQ